jgi:hypothetical protein
MKWSEMTGLLHNKGWMGEENDDDEDEKLFMPLLPVQTHAW